MNLISEARKSEKRKLTKWIWWFYINTEKFFFIALSVIDRSGRGKVLMAHALRGYSGLIPIAGWAISSELLGLCIFLCILKRLGSTALDYRSGSKTHTRMFIAAVFWIMNISKWSIYPLAVEQKKLLYLHNGLHMCINMDKSHAYSIEKKTVAENMQCEVMYANVKHLPNNIVIIQRFLHTP